MPDRRPAEPDWANNDNWDEFEWEQALKHSDHVASRYFRLLNRFGDLPDAEELIAGRLGEDGFFEFQDESFYVYEEGNGDWGFDSDDDDDDDEDGEDDEDSGRDRDGPGDRTRAPGDTFFFEASPVYHRGRQVALGWCNIVASVLSPEDRQWGIGILFRLGRLLSYLALSIGDGLYDRPSASIAFAKRALDEVNVVLGEIERITQRGPKYRTVMKLIRELLLETHDLLVTHLFELRDRGNTGINPLGDDDI